MKLKMFNRMVFTCIVYVFTYLQVCFYTCIERPSDTIQLIFIMVNRFYPAASTANV